MHNIEIFNLVPVIILVISSLLGSGIVFTHKRIFTFLSTVLVLWQAQWMLISLASRTALQNFGATKIFIFGSIIFFIFWVIQYKKWKFPKSENKKELIWSNLVPLIILGVVVYTILRISSVNGLMPDGTWKFHGYYNGDTFLLSSLVERSLNQTLLVDQNPSAANSPLPYPTVIHAAIADFLKTFGLSSNWLYLLPAFTIAQAFAIIGMFFALVDVFSDKMRQSRRFHVLSGLIVLLVMTYSWSDYVFPQTHLFVIALELFLASILLRNESSGLKNLILWFPIAAITAFLLLVSNSILGTVSVVIIAAYSLFKIISKNNLRTKVTHIILIIFWFNLFKNFSAGNPNLGQLTISYEYASQLLQQAGLFLLLIFAGLLYRKDGILLKIMATFTALLSFIALFFSQSSLLLENSGRFLYESIRIAFPLIIPLSLIGLDKVFLSQKNTFLPKVVSFGLLSLAGLLILILPALASVSKTQYNLEKGDEFVILKNEIEAFNWIKANTKPDAVFLANPEQPWPVPFFTGRAILRAEGYWASPQDGVLDSVKKAFANDPESQASVLEKVDYVILHQKIVKNWVNQKITRVYKSNGIYIYKTNK